MCDVDAEPCRPYRLGSLWHVGSRENRGYSDDQSALKAGNLRDYERRQALPDEQVRALQSAAGAPDRALRVRS